MVIFFFNYKYVFLHNIDQIKMTKTQQTWFKKIFVRDISITGRGFFYFLIVIIFYLNTTIFLLFSFISFTPLKIDSKLSVIFVISTIFTLSLGGLIVDKFKNRMRLALYSVIGQLTGLIFFYFLSIVEIIGLIGFSIMCISSGLFLINLLTIITHETTILSRARIIGYLFFLASIVSFSIIILTDLVSTLFFNAKVVVLIIIQSVIFVLMIDIVKKYSYIETEERLTSEFRFRGILIKQRVFGYLFAFLGLGFILGNAIPIGIELSIEPILFSITLLFFFVQFGLLFDNRGVKFAYVGGIFLLASIIIFSEIYLDFYLALFFGISIPLVIIGLFTMIGDFSTERWTLKYRGRISSIFILFVFVGILAGLAFKIILTLIFLQTQLFWLPYVASGIGTFFLIGLLVWLMPLPEILSSKESDWAETLRSIYIFNKESLCLYSKDFIQPDKLKLSEDLITGGLAGILSLLSEITNERRNLKVIDKDRVKIYFSYGKSIIVALTSVSDKYLPILNKKLYVFTKVYEKKFEFELTNFSGKTNAFIQGSEPLIGKYFR